MAVVVAHAAGPTPSPAGTSPAPTPIVVVDDHGFDWADAGIGAAATLGLVLGGVGLAAIRGTYRESEPADRSEGGGRPES